MSKLTLTPDGKLVRRPTFWTSLLPYQQKIAGALTELPPERTIIVNVGRQTGRASFRSYVCRLLGSRST